MKTPISRAVGVLLVMFVAVGLSACGGEGASGPSGPPPTPSGFTRHAGTDKGCSIAFPDDWDVQEGWPIPNPQVSGVVMGLSPFDDSADQFQENVTVVIEQLPFEISLDTYSRQAERVANQSMMDFNELVRKRVKLHPGEAEFVEFTHRVGQVRMHAGQYYLVAGDRAYVITCTTEPGQFDRYRGRFEKIAGTFAIE